MPWCLAIAGEEGGPSRKEIFTAGGFYSISQKEYRPVIAIFLNSLLDRNDIEYWRTKVLQATKQWLCGAVALYRLEELLREAFCTKLYG